MKVALLAAALTLGVASEARADRNTVSLGLPSLAAHGLAVELERDLPAQHVAVVGALAMRSTAGGDYDSRSLAVGVEVRYWLRRRAIWTRRPRGEAIGWYVGARLDLGRTTVMDGGGDELGSQDSLGIAVLAGYRFAPWRGLEVRPFGGLAVRTESDPSGRLSSWTRPSLSAGLAVGWRW